jgi:hypothetical protein
MRPGASTCAALSVWRCRLPERLAFHRSYYHYTKGGLTKIVLLWRFDLHLPRMIDELPATNAEPAAVPEPEPAAPAPAPIAKPTFVCERFTWGACEGEPFYKEHEGKQYCVLHYPGKEKSAAFAVVLQKKLEAEDFNFRDVWFPEAVNFQNFEFSDYSDFSYATFSARANFIGATFSDDASFGFATFSDDASFSSATFSGEANFTYATFSGEAYFSSATFSAEANFIGATFNDKSSFYETTFSAGAYFSPVIFSNDTSFMSATFRGETEFQSATFNADAKFNCTTFSAEVFFHASTFSAYAEFASATFSGEAEFSSATFSAETKFSYAIFKDQIRFSGNNSFRSRSSLNLEFLRVDKPDLVSFHTVTLRPHWFVNVDPRKFVFTDVDWNWRATSIKGEIKSLAEKSVSSPRRLLAIACRQLAENAESNNRYEEAARFRYWAMDLLRPQKWAGWRFWKTDWLHILYWAVSGYGERILRGLACLASVWVVFALLYTQIGFTKPEDKSATPSPITATEPDTVGQPLPFKDSFAYSFSVMSLQKPEPKPLTRAAKWSVLLETVLGPVQAALLALAIRRKFMR